MALQDITNKPSKIRLQVDLETEYATLRSRHVAPNISYDQLRMQGAKAIDLWIDGNLYPLDPISGAPPPFKSIASFFKFVGDGFNGLLGYCRRLHMLWLDEAAGKRQTQFDFDQLQAASTKQINSLMQRIKELSEELEVQKTNLADRVHTINQFTDNYVRLQHSTRNLRRRVHHFTHLPIGYHARQRKRKAVGLLSRTAGACKRRKQTTR